MYKKREKYLTIIKPAWRNKMEWLTNLHIVALHFQIARAIIDALTASCSSVDVYSQPHERNSYRCAYEPNKNYAEGSRSAGWHQFSQRKGLALVYIMSDFRSIADGIPVLNAGPCALHWPNWCRDMFDIRRSTTQAWTTEPLWEKHRKSHLFDCLSFSASGGRTTAQEPSKGFNRAVQAWIWSEGTGGPRAVSPALING